MVTANAAMRLIQHYVDNFRRLPWRSPPGAAPPEPYRVWLSEIMLQQTNVATVIPRFERFLARWPTVELLAAASDEAILGEWAGLGYYARARNLIACAREVARRGDFPRSAAELRQLPGIGAYTAAAIAAIAFGERAAAVDTNVERVIARLEGLQHPRRAHLEKVLVEMMAGVSPGDLVQAMMDLGATVCRPRAPLCDRCPVSAWCAGFGTGAPETYPRKLKKAERPRRHGVAYVLTRGAATALVRRSPKGLLGGMLGLPTSDWRDRPWTDAEAVAAAPAPGAWRDVGTVEHVFTHFSLTLRVLRAESNGEGEFVWTDPAGLGALPSVFLKAAKAGLA
jgi:A/G-specific adenine glycosylase